MSKQVLNRPMFANMKDGTIKPVQYAYAGRAIKLALPYAGRGLSAIKNTLPAIITKGRNLITGGGARATGGGTGTAVGPYLGGGGSGLPAIAGGTAKTGGKGKQLLKMFGFGAAPATVVGLSDMMRPDQEEPDTSYQGPQVEKPKDSPTGIPSKKDKGIKIEEDVITDINDGNLDDMISEKMFNDKYKTPNFPSQNENLIAHSKNSNEIIKNINVIRPQKAII